MLKIVTIVGARPQFIKAATVSRAISRHNDSTNSSNPITEVLVHTGQHYDQNMSNIFFDELEIPEPHYNLNIGSDTHGRQTGKMLGDIEEVLEKERPDWTLVYGDTNSTLAGALAASKLHIPVAHVEAGLRSFNRRMPEEINRVVADHLSTILLCPTATAVNNLRKEGFTNIANDGALIEQDMSKNTLSALILQFSPFVANVGDVMYDAMLFYSHLAETKSNVFNRLQITQGEYILSTIHRPENTDVSLRLQNIMSALKHIADQIEVILPLHPRTRKILHDTRLSTGNIRIIDPLPYFDILLLEKYCQLLITDSGGMQKEAYFSHKPCITARDETEWVELANAGVNRVVGADKSKIIESFDKWRNQEFDFSQTFYGNGKAGKIIVNTILNQ